MSAIHTPRPLAIMRAVLKHYFGAAKQADDFRRERGTHLPEWPDWCYLPLHASYAIVSGGGDNRVPFERAHHVGILGAMLAWRLSQGIYRYDATLYEALITTPVKGDLPGELLLTLPEWCAYIETPGLTYSGRVLHGAWVHLDWHQGELPELRYVLDCADATELALDAEHGLIPLPIIIGDGGIEAALQRVIESGRQQAAKHGMTVASGVHEETARITAQLVSLTLYLCSEAPDWGGEAPGKPRPIRTKQGWRLFPADKPKPWDIGIRLGAAIRRAQQASDLEQSEHLVDGSADVRSRPRAHLRRAHWHTFRTGEGRVYRALRWLPPIPVNIDSREELPAVLHQVKP